MNIALWVAQGLMALVMVGAGTMKLLTPKTKLAANPRMGWAADFSATQIKLIALAEVLGAIGLVVPWATGILQVLTPVAAACLAILMIGAATVHASRKEPFIPVVVFVLLLAFVAVGRFGLLPG